jgi:hypothetical protein
VPGSQETVTRPGPHCPSAFRNMATRAEIWQQLKNDRGFSRTKHCLIHDESVMPILRAKMEESRKGFGSTDFMGRNFDESCDLIVIPAYSYKLLAKKLSSDDLQSDVPKIVDKMLEFLKSGEVHQFVQVQEIKSDHVTFDDKILRTAKQYGCFAANEIPEGTVLGQYVGELKMELLHESDSDNPDSGPPEHAPEYAFALCVIDSAELFVDAKRFGNEMAFINDGRPDKSRNNVAYLQVSVNGVPVIFILSLRRISAGEELLTHYGERFWNGHRGAAARHPAHPSAAAARRVLRAKRPVRGFFLDPSDEGGCSLLPSRLEFLREWPTLKAKENDGQAPALPPTASLTPSLHPFLHLAPPGPPRGRGAPPPSHRLHHSIPPSLHPSPPPSHPPTPPPFHPI